MCERSWVRLMRLPPKGSIPVGCLVHGQPQSLAQPLLTNYWSFYSRTSLFTGIQLFYISPRSSEFALYHKSFKHSFILLLSATKQGLHMSLQDLFTSTVASSSSRILITQPPATCLRRPETLVRYPARALRQAGLTLLGTLLLSANLQKVHLSHFHLLYIYLSLFIPIYFFLPI